MFETGEFERPKFDCIFFSSVLSRTMFNPIYALLDSSFWFDMINLEWSTVNMESSIVIITK